MNIKRGIVKRLFVVCAGLLIAQYTLTVEAASMTETHWLRLAQDGLHDPALGGLNSMQNPEEALSRLPHNGAGNQVDWVMALEKGYIRPYDNIGANITLKPGTRSKVLESDVLRRNTGEMDMVLFPHKQHTELLACSSCHEKPFKSKAGATKFGMLDILNGEYCGRCHGAVAFPLTECKRCHSVPRPPIIIPSNNYPLQK